jgi:hypothetical protein
MQCGCTSYDYTDNVRFTVVASVQKICWSLTVEGSSSKLEGAREE